MIRYFLLTWVLLCLIVVAIAGFRGQHSSKPPLEIFIDMDHQPRYEPQHESNFFADGRAARVPVAGTVPMGYVMPHAYLQTGGNNNKAGTHPGGFSVGTDYYDTGRIGGMYGDGIPVELTPALLDRGRERFTINCAICHGATAGGNGMVKKYGLTTVANLQDELYLKMPDGQIFNTITHGKNTMGAYGPQITVEDRWAIISYLRALQRSQHARMGDVPADQQAQLTKPAAAAPPAGGAAQ